MTRRVLSSILFSIIGLLALPIVESHVMRTQGIESAFAAASAKSSAPSRKALRESRRKKPLKKQSSQSSTSSVKTSSSSSSSSSPKAIDIDPLPFLPPRTSHIILGRTSPVVDICNKKTHVATFTSDVANMENYIKEYRSYSIDTKELLAVSSRLKDDAWYFDTVPAVPFYNRLVLRSYLPEDKLSIDFSEKYRIAFLQTCEGKNSSLTLYPVPAGLTDIRSDGPESAPFPSGQLQRIGSFVFVGEKSDPDLHVRIKEMNILLSKSANILVSNFQLERVIDGIKMRTPCLFNKAPIITCEPSEEISDIDGPVTFTILADVTTVKSGPAHVQLMMSDFGSPFLKGSVLWKNDAEHFTWVSPTQELLKSTRFTKN